MESKERPEQGGQPPIPEEQMWHLREGEMTIDEIRSLAKYVYCTILNGYVAYRTNSLRLAIEQNHGQEPVHNVQPAEAYINSFASQRGLSTQVIQKWANCASIERAQRHLSLLLSDKKKEEKNRRGGTKDTDRQYEALLEPLTRVFLYGTKATFVIMRHL
jgi:hypothetical protein